VGLTLVKSLVELHGGTVTVRSAGPNHGSEFVVRLPAVPPVACERETRLPIRTRLASGTGPLRIAVVEDNPDSRQTLESLLQLEGHDVRTAETGVAGLELIVGWQPDLALVDIGLPELDGFELARRVGQQHPGLLTRLVALTGYGSPADQEKVKACGFAAHLVKPLRLAELRRLIARPRESAPEAGSGAVSS
jgi:two-component system CheB/CheR fusion protein